MLGNSFFFLKNTLTIYPLDNLSSNSILAASLRKLRSAYSGSCIRIRRGSDNAEQDIGFVDNYADIASVIAFTGYQNLFADGENLNAAVKTNCTVNSNTDTAPNGTLSADTMVATATNNVRIHNTVNIPSVVGFFTFSASIKKGRNFCAGVFSFNSGAKAIFNGTTGAYQGTTTIGTNISVFRYSCVTHPDNSNYWLVIVTVYRPTPDSQALYGGIAINNSFGTTWATGWDAVIGDTLTAWGLNLQIGFYQGYTPGNLTLATLRQTRITTVYDQSGNNRNLTQTTAASQPYLVLDQNGKWGIYDQKTTRGIGYSGTVFASSSSIWVNNVWALNEAPTAQISLWTTQNDITPALYLAVQNANVLQLYGGAYITVGTIASQSLRVQTSQRTGNNGNVWLNGTLSLNNEVIGFTSGITGFWNTHPSFGTGSSIETKEIVLFNSLSATDRQTLERNQGNYYNITVA